MNELIFFLHMLVNTAFVLVALRLGSGALTAYTAIQAILANLFVVKQMKLFGLFVTCADIFAIGSIISLNLLQEYFGKEKAKEAIKMSLISLLFFALFSQIHVSYLPIENDAVHGAFELVFSSSTRILLASFAAFFIVQQFDVRLFPWLKGYLPVRVGISLMISQLLDTLLFSFLGLYGSVESIRDVILVSFFVKCLVIWTSAPFTAFSKRFVRHEISV